MADDPDPESRAQLSAILDAGDRAALSRCLTPPLAFGTAGMRGRLGPGPGQMNRAVVRRVGASLARSSLGQEGSGPVVIGFDAREGSRIFAEDTARILAGAGLPVLLFPSVVPTPLLAFAVGYLGARAGVMVTASHNPPTDNGYKVYGPHGGQIVPPVDAEIAEGMEVLGPTLALPLAPELPGAPSPELVDAYISSTLALRVRQRRSPLRIAYTPLHGVGRDLLLRILHAGGYDDVHVVASQAEPDGAFPTVAFPNPEEPGALDLVCALALEVGADLILANDPDADRIAVAVPIGGRIQVLSGDMVGCLLAEDLLASGGEGGSPRCVATTVVSSRLLRSIAARHGADYVETLTGFKWIAQAAIGCRGRFVLGYEEALGVCVGEAVRDKDGLSAALLIADLASDAGASGETLLDRLDALYRAHGVHEKLQRSLVWSDPRLRSRAMEGLRRRPPAELGGLAIESMSDGLGGGELPPADLLGFELQGARVLVRPSGTEPKLKLYVEATEPPSDELQRARITAKARARAIADDLTAQLAAWVGPPG
ncbi:MAG TPA: phospho-sugar mutase [Deltaproteobacteria bacterium]|nr:phospho-sugar mutase [Deltaproteobacteria bacterium]